MSEEVWFTKEEAELLEGKSLFIIKQSVIAKLLALFGQLHESLNSIVGHCHLPYREELLKQTGKISKGENYLGYPWLILDYPRQFGKEDVFAFRSLCWWGNEYSFTLHLSGKFLHAVADLHASLNKLKGKNLYICISDSPWNYHFGEDNYLFLDNFLDNSNAGKNLHAFTFLKLSSKLNINETSKVMVNACSMFEDVTESLFIVNKESAPKE